LGPWHSCDHRVGRQDGARIADTWSSAVPRDEQVANANLIAAAPELLEALRRCLEELSHLRDDRGFDHPRAIWMASKAIAKAEGEA
jgi:hypothetical protein